jgi:type VI secretion system protein ImpK
MTSPPLPASGAAHTASAVTPVGAGRLALVLQEVFTAITRLRGGRQAVTDAEAFRAHVLQLLQRAEQDGHAAGFDTGDMRLALFAVVALLDESALNAPQPALADWPRRTLQEELFGGHMGGELFFQYAEQMLARPDSPALVDVLEVYELCLLLGFRGRYGGGDGGSGAIHALVSRIGERVHRLRGRPAGAELAPHWRPADDAVASRDPWVRRLIVMLAASVVLVLVLWGSAALSLRGGSTDLDAMATPPPSAPTTR